MLWEWWSERNRNKFTILKDVWMSTYKLKKDSDEQSVPKKVSLSVSPNVSRTEKQIYKCFFLSKYRVPWANFEYRTISVESCEAKWVSEGKVRLNSYSPWEHKIVQLDYSICMFKNSILFYKCLRYMKSHRNDSVFKICSKFMRN